MTRKQENSSSFYAQDDKKKSRLFALIQAENKQEMSESYGNQGLKQAGYYFAKTLMTSHYNLKTTKQGTISKDIFSIDNKIDMKNIL